MKKVAFSLILTSWVFGSLMAQENITSTEYKSPVKKWSAVTYLDTRAGMENETGATGSLTSTFRAILNYDLGQGYKASAMLGAYHDFRKIERTNELYNGFVSLGKGMVLNDVVVLGLSGKAYLPLSRIERDNKSFRTRIEFTSGLTVKFDRYGLGGFSINYAAQFGQNIYQYETGISGSVNTRSDMTHSVGISQKITEELSVKSTFSNTHSWTYYGSRRPDRFSLGVEGNYAITKELKIGAGYAIGDTTYGYDGTSFNIDLLDLTKSSIYTSLSYVF